MPSPPVPNFHGTETIFFQAVKNTVNIIQASMPFRAETMDASKHQSS